MDVDDHYDRTLNDVKTVITHAKLEEDDLHPVSQNLYFGTRFENFKFLELNNTVLEHLEVGQRVVFRGEEDDRAVLCTESQTYEVKEAETSNSMLLVPNLRWPEDMLPSVNDDRMLERREIVGIHYSYYELRVCKPRLKKLRRILQESAYRGSELESELQESNVKFYTSDDLETIQASKEELKDALNVIDAVCLNGYWRVLDFDYHYRILSLFLDLINSNSWSIESIPAAEVLSELKDLIPELILQHLVKIYTDPVENSDSGSMVKLKADKVCRFLAEALLRSLNRFNLKDFLKAWQDSVPEGLKVDVKQLEGLALIDSDTKPPIISLYPESDLPEEIQPRIEELFTVREKWTFDQIKPYVEPLATAQLNVNALLTKYARPFFVQNVKHYCARHKK